MNTLFDEKCEHCNKIVSPGEIELLDDRKCSILTEDETYKICEYCIGEIEAEKDEYEEIQYWNEWVNKKRIS
ncbi:hypothetical protein [Brevibacillus sp. SAFN-007a]|uniref:hypothetical protein n=1 Tax=Brevibacillus sp. SAFN-007a TaxID=3436862 RepID=UPI003F805105